MLDLVDAERSESADRSAQLTVLGLVERVGRNGYRPTTAGWNLLGERGRAFRTD
ncbi:MULTISPECIES: hypothetical protein [Brevundimonas]|uniref:hypothetical protein n=1 Tax=Brevundimonas TaxID=41275 RepID=UPI001E3A2CC1|nr:MULTISPECIES: hypothetical protein [Brevundimonas]